MGTEDLERRFGIAHEPLFGALELVDVDALMEYGEDDWSNWPLVRVNDTMLRLAICKGEFPWHEHGEHDEYFQVLSGTFFVDLEDRSYTLKPGQGLMVPRGTRHRTRAIERATVLVAGHVSADLLGRP